MRVKLHLYTTIIMVYNIHILYIIIIMIIFVSLGHMKRQRMF